MSNTVRKPRHKSRKHRHLTTAQAILVVAEELCASRGPTEIKLADIAAELGIETPSLYRHYDGIGGLIAALACVALQAEIDTFSDLDELSFEEATRTQSARLFDLYITRPGLARFLNVHIAIPGGLAGFESEKTSTLGREFYRVEKNLFQKGELESAMRPMTEVTFLALRFGTAIFATSMLSSRPTISKTQA